MGRCLSHWPLITFFGRFVFTVMSKSDHICRNPECKARFSKYNRILSRRVPALVDTAALDAYYAANPDKAVHRSPDRVCSHCGHRDFVKPPTWLPQYLRAPMCVVERPAFVMPCLCVFVSCPVCILFPCVFFGQCACVGWRIAFYFVMTIFLFCVCLLRNVDVSPTNADMPDDFAVFDGDSDGIMSRGSAPPSRYVRITSTGPLCSFDLNFLDRFFLSFLLLFLLL